MNPFTDMNPEPNDLEYQRFGETRIYTIPPEFKLWVRPFYPLFSLNYPGPLGGHLPDRRPLPDGRLDIHLLRHCQPFQSVFHLFLFYKDTGPYNPAIPLLVTVIGLLLLGNGLFGQNFRGVSLTIYVFVFQVDSSLLPL